MLVFCAMPAYAQELNLDEPPVQKDTKETDRNTVRAEKFFNECVADPIIKTSEKTDLAFCACTASSLYAWLDTPIKQKDNREFFEALTDKKLDKEILLTKVYGPCLNIPIYEMRFDECFYNKKKIYFTGNPKRRQNMCSCIAKGEALYFKKFAVPFLELKISEGKKFDDPIKEIKRDLSYYDAYFNLENNCYETYSNKE